MKEINTLHTIINIKIKGHKNSWNKIPCLVLIGDNPEIYNPLFNYIKYLSKNKNKSHSTLLKIVKSVGFFYDYFHITKKGKASNSHDVRLIIEEFLQSRLHGDVLRWSSVKATTVNIDLQNISGFFHWMSLYESGVEDINPKIKKINPFKQSYLKQINLKRDILAHITPIQETEHLISKIKTIKGNTVPKAFPTSKIFELIQNTPNVRDKILFLMLAFGGRRVSETLQIFTSDIKINESDDIVALICHPSDSKFQWVDKSGLLISKTRKDYLKQIYNIKPRTEMIGDSSYCGWKGMLFDDEIEGTSYLYLIGEIKNYLKLLHCQYMLERKKYNHHPYYFIKKNGNPLTIKNIQKTFYRVCNKIGLDPEYFKANQGISIHGLRHFYGYYCVNVLKLDINFVQRAMGHVSQDSTTHYSRVSFSEANKIIQIKILESKLTSDITQKEKDIIIEKIKELNNVDETLSIPSWILEVSNDKN